MRKKGTRPSALQAQISSDWIAGMATSMGLEDTYLRRAKTWREHEKEREIAISSRDTGYSIDSPE